MRITELLLTALGLAMDAFAAALCQGLRMPKLRWGGALIIGLFFGAFQALMPLVGWLLGSQFERYITSVDHWVVCALLAFVGGRMIHEALRGGGEDCGVQEGLNFKELVTLSFATSIDALAVGISFAFLNVRIVPSALTIGGITFALSVLGVCLGRRFGARYKKHATLIGGCILVLIGIKILLEHLGVLG
ncbi:MAG: manganese efflux pump MntP family protein [Clostridia bacterium]|nr:manganese efflux pump MntP family protein [Clostridia bacterium]